MASCQLQPRKLARKMPAQALQCFRAASVQEHRKVFLLRPGAAAPHQIRAAYPLLAGKTAPPQTPRDGRAVRKRQIRGIDYGPESRLALRRDYRMHIAHADVSRFASGSPLRDPVQALPPISSIDVCRKHSSAGSVVTVRHVYTATLNFISAIASR